MAGTQNKGTLFFKSLLETSVTLQQAITVLPVSRVQSKDRVKAARNSSLPGKQKVGKEQSAGEQGTVLASELLIPSYRWPFQKTGDLEKPEQRECSNGATIKEHPILTFGTYHLTAGFSCFTLSPRQSNMCLKFFWK